MLEAQCHERSSFATFTYEKEPADGWICKSDLTTTIHRLRERARDLDGRSVRYFGVGEFGELRGRPHYHAALFGVGQEDRELVVGAWNALRATDGRSPGFVHLGSLTPDSAAYVTGYVTAKLEARLTRDPQEREREFMVCSRRPGIGCLGIESLIDALNSSAGALYFARCGDVPTSIQIGGRSMPLGGHIRRQLRLFFFGEESQPKAAKELQERDFYAKNLPFVPPDASPTLRKIAQEVFSREASASHDAYFEALKQRGVQRAKKHAIKRSMRKL